MKQWVITDLECCPECGSDIEIYCDHNNWAYEINDSDPVRCTECDYESCISVGEDGNTWLQDKEG